MKTFTFFLVSLFSVNMIAQDPGDLYPDFGDDGIIMEDWDDTSTFVLDIVSLDENSLAITYNVSDHFLSTDVIAVTCVDATGHIMEFGNTNRGFMHDFTVMEIAQCALRTPDGKILVAGTYGSMSGYFPYVVRLTASGALDETFGDEGIYTDLDLDFRISCMELYQQGETYSILVSGLDQLEHSVIMMLNSDGTVNTDFGDMGIFDLGYFNGLIRNFEVDSENDDLYAGINLESGIKIIKLSLSEEALDENFGTDGILNFTPAESFYGELSSLIYKADNNTLAVFGHYPHPAGDDDIYAYRVNADDGSADAGFGVGGLATLRSAGSEDEIHDAILQSDGKYCFGGSTNFSGTEDFLLGRLNDNGGPDLTFGTNGLYILVAPLDQSVSDLELSSDESILYAAGNMIGMEQSLIVSAHYTGLELVPASKHDVVNVKTYPNPTSGDLIIETGYNGLHRYELRNLSGSLVKSGQHNGGHFNINMSSLPASAYFLTVTMPDNQVTNFKILKH